MPSTHRPPRIALAGIRGFGSVHLATIARLGDRVHLVAAADPAPGSDADLPDGVRHFATLPDLLAQTDDLDIVIVATPIASHAALTIAAMDAGADVYVEKPTASSLAAFHEMLEASIRTGRAVQVGFQSLGSHAIPAIRDGSLPGVGRVWAASAYGAWLRRRSYWSRSPWAGRRMLDGEHVVDGVVTNPLAHAVATALAAVGARREDDVTSVDADLYRANAIEADDTSVVRASTPGGPVTAALTLDAPTQELPFVTIRGELGDARFWYTEDLLDLPDGSQLAFDRTDLLENLIDHRIDGTPLLCGLEDSGAFMRVLEAVRVTEPRQIAERFVQWRDEGPDAHPVVTDVEHWLSVAADQHATLSELGAPWAAPRVDRSLHEISLEGGGGATYQDGGSITPTSSPRPYLHPVTTPAGVVVSAHHPADHDWHFGLGVAIQDVDGTNFWGGRTYVRDRGYVWRDDHGRIESRALTSTAAGFVDEREWVDRDGRPVLAETLAVATRPVPNGWMFELSFSLEPTGDDPVSLGSPGSNGRERGGYGGLFWRLPECDGVVVRTPSARGEDDVHGSRAGWLAWSARFDGGEATVALAPADDTTARDPWFVRVEAYPGLGSSIAWDRPVVVEPGIPLRRSFRGLVADGILDDDAIAGLMGGGQ